jgi:hypothetical protein
MKYDPGGIYNIRGMDPKIRRTLWDCLNKITINFNQTIVIKKSDKFLRFLDKSFFFKVWMRQEHLKNCYGVSYTLLVKINFQPSNGNDIKVNKFFTVIFIIYQYKY